MSDLLAAHRVPQGRADLVDRPTTQEAAQGAASTERGEMITEDATECATERAELAAGVCQATWRNHPHEYLRDDPAVYRQHRCGRDLQYGGACRCRYCQRDRG